MDLPTTIIGLLALAAAMIISDWVKQKHRTKTDDSKIGELSKQTQLLAELCDNAQITTKSNRKIWKRVKRINKRVDALYIDRFPKNKTQ